MHQSAIDPFFQYTLLDSTRCIYLSGVHLLDLFVVDLIGRGSAKAKVFMNQSDSFRESRVVTLGLKGLLSSTVISINIFFIFSCMLYAKDKGKCCLCCCSLYCWRSGILIFYSINSTNARARSAGRAAR